MKIVSVIGTRPQYIKLKPIFDTFRKENVKHYILDTAQHYDDKVSKNIIDDLNLKIDHTLDLKNLNELDFISNGIIQIRDKLLEQSPDVVLVFGDTNTTLCASIVAHKIGIKLAHIEAGERGESNAPEEINRLYADSTSKIHFCSSVTHLKNVANPILTGDLEYELLNQYDPDITYDDFAVLTVHRQENMSREKIEEIFDFLNNLNTKIIFPVHHRTKKVIRDNNLKVSNMIKMCEPLNYTDMVKHLAACKFVITDSGGVHKCSPFFGKKSLIMRSGKEWYETYEKGFSKKYTGSADDINWLNDCRIERDKTFYLVGRHMPSQIILETLRENSVL